jgi:hypothetical protein
MGTLDFHLAMQQTNLETLLPCDKYRSRRLRTSLPENCSSSVLPDGIYIFKPKIFIWENFWRAFQWKLLVNLIDIWSILRPFDIFYGHLVHFVCM